MMKARFGRRGVRSAIVSAVAILGLPLAAQASNDEEGSSTTPAPTTYQQVCIDAWNDAPASSVCTASSVSRIGASTAGDRGNCDVRGISCSVSATDSQGNSVSWSWSGGSNRSPANTEELDMCFAADSSGTAGYTAYFRVGCNTGETTSSDMSGSTLSSSSNSGLSAAGNGS